MSIFIDMSTHLQICVHFCRFVHTFTDVSKHSQISVRIYRHLHLQVWLHLRFWTHICRYLYTFANLVTLWHIKIQIHNSSLIFENSSATIMAPYKWDWRQFKSGCTLWDDGPLLWDDCLLMCQICFIMSHTSLIFYKGTDPHLYAKRSQWCFPNSSLLGTLQHL